MCIGVNWLVGFISCITYAVVHDSQKNHDAETVSYLTV